MHKISKLCFLLLVGYQLPITTAQYDMHADSLHVELTPDHVPPVSHVLIFPLSGTSRNPMVQEIVATVPGTLSVLEYMISL